MRSWAARDSRARRRSPGLRGRKPSKQNRSEGQGGQDGRGARGDSDGHLRPHGGTDEPVAGVGDRWHAGVGDDQDAKAGAGGVEQLGGAIALIVLVEGDDAPVGLDAEALRQGAQPTGVLGGDEVGLLQGAPQAL